jgi:hypothetical protein
MRDFSQITLVSVTGLMDAHSAALALDLSLRQLPGAQALLLCPEAPANLSPEIRYRKIAPMNRQEYSWFMMFALWKFIETEYALVIQDDGWVLDASNWRDEFFDYDFVGAPAQLGRVDTPEGTRWLKDFAWRLDRDQPNCIVRPVLNGGFSLRSRRMLRALCEHPELSVVIPSPSVSESEPIRMEWPEDSLLEDVQLTGVLRPALEIKGFRFAPLDIAKMFAFELPVFLPPEGLSRTFGCHGSWRRLISTDPLTVRYGVTRSYVDNHVFEPAVVNMLKERGYQIEFVPEFA